MLSFLLIASAALSLAQTELSNDAYCEFLNACAKRGDPHQLWNKLMADHFFGGIVRTGAAGDWKYSAKPGYGRKPVTYISWESAARYCNWLSYGRPVTGASELGTTEGDEAFGVYDTRQFGTPAFVRSTKPVRRNTDKAYFLPTADEWRAAAAGAETGTPIVYDGGWVRPFPHLADVADGVTNREGRVNLHGNVAEWVETRRGFCMLALGGSLIRGAYSLAADFVEGDESNKPIGSFGIRVASKGTPLVLPRPTGKQTIEKSESLSVESPWVRVGDVGNRRDPIHKVGRVDYEYEIAKYALTCGEWCEFLNAVALNGDPFGLYNRDMATGACGGIVREKGRYAVKTGWAKRPVVYIGYKDVMRYCNWLHYGKPRGKCVLGVTEGTDAQGAYDTRLGCSFHRNEQAKYFIPTDNEWCKAAYYDPTRLGGHKYWDYPCRTSDVPPNDPAKPHGCNYMCGTELGEKGPYYLAEVDAYPNSDTYYGCRQMAGNVWEWVEPVGTARLNLRGGSFGYTEFGMGIWNRDEAGENDELSVFGVRLARRVKNARRVEKSLKDKVREFIGNYL